MIFIFSETKDILNMCVFSFEDNEQIERQGEQLAWFQQRAD